MVSLGAK